MIWLLSCTVINYLVWRIIIIIIIIIIINFATVINNIFVYTAIGKSLKFPAHNRSVNNNTVL